ncbi:LuxR C-terminal-related transcriptional regulator [Flavobacterium aquicola]|uniref:PAS domain-containing protein n=1 Tax=Flavobacterium aquicola TaxID=1682742 RepID=A0A3E0E0N8_9FLAO|nr:LuxR C-terminal-related transcriptional regulator [Flavobacterium aquicola]REG90456.1 PAS domain-containing protein [Flavobacterium aquicola]
MKKEPLEELEKIWNKIAKSDVSIPPDYNLEYIKRIVDIFSVGEYYYLIFNLATSTIEYVQDNVTNVLGCLPEEFTTEYVIANIHPEDITFFMNVENTAMKFFSQFAPEKLMKYKIRYDYRLKHTNGKYVRILQQIYTIQTSPKGGVMRVLDIHIDISHLKSLGRPILSFIGLDDEPSYIDVEIQSIFKPTKGILTKREKEILRNLIDGHNSKSLSEKLFLSIETINTHRRNILKKTKTKNTTEIITKAIREGWF